MALVAACYLGGVGWRHHHILVAHPLADYVYSDMEGYERASLQRLDPTYHPSIVDTLYPPGASFFFAALHRLDAPADARFRATGTVMFVLSCLLPLLIAGLAKLLFGEAVALIVLGMASLYFPFIDFFAYFLAEGPFMLAAYGAALLLVLAIRGRRRAATAAVLATAAGALLGAAAAFKVVALLWLPATFVLLALWRWRDGAQGMLRVGIFTMLGGVLVLAPLGVRCTRLAEGRLCVVSNNGPMNAVLGHAEVDALVIWSDGARRFAFSSPSERPYPERPRLALDFAVYDAGANLRYVLGQARAHPLAFVGRSLAQVRALFPPAVPWPSGYTTFRRTALLFDRLALVFLLVPALLYLARVRKALVRLRPDAARELLLCTPLVCQVLAALVTIGEARFRIVLDGFVMILAAVQVLWWSGVGPAPTCKAPRSAPPQR